MTIPTQAAPAPAQTRTPPLRVENVSVHFAGVRALSEVSFTVEPGTIHGLIGPNGAGKSTCFNVISGVYHATAGRVWLGDTEVTGLRPHRVAAMGVGRAFQNIALSKHQTVLENLMLGRHHLTRAGFLSTGLWLPNAFREHRRHEQRVREIAAFLGLGDKLTELAGGLSYGDQKRVEVARALAMEPQVLLLDEPVAGMNAEETRLMALTIMRIRSALGISILLVEHDMGLVMAICDRITVLDFGNLIADGSPDEVQRNPDVIRAYLGGGNGNGKGNASPDSDPTGEAGP